METTSTYEGPRLARVRPPIAGFDPERAALMPRVVTTEERRHQRRESAAKDARSLMRRWLSRPDLTLADVADELHVTTRHLQRVFHSQRSPGFRAELTEMRMDQAADLLAEGDRPIAEIANLVGYRGPMHFAKAFRRSRGCSPREYRRRLAAQSA